MLRSTRFVGPQRRGALPNHPIQNLRTHADIYLNTLEKPNIFRSRHDRPDFELRDWTRLGAMVRHVSLINRLPSWAIPRFAAFLHHSNLSAHGQLRWCHRFVNDRKKVIWREIDNILDKLLDALVDGRQVVRTIDETLNRSPTSALNRHQESADVQHTIEAALSRMRRVRGCNPSQLKWLRSVLASCAGDQEFKLAEEKIARSISNTLNQRLSKLHPAGQLLIHEFLTQKAALTTQDRTTTSPIQKLLCRGLGFVPRPKTITIISNVIAHATRNAHLLQHVHGHPGADSPTALLYHEKLKDLCHNIAIPDNLPKDERAALTEATKDKTHVFVPTDKTNKVLIVTKNLMGTTIENFLEKGRGKTFDLFDDPISFGAVLLESKRNTHRALETFLTEIKHVPFANHYKGTPDFVHGVRFSKGIPALEKIIKVLAHEFDYAPSFGPLKPHIKDHKMEGDVRDVINALENPCCTANKDADHSTLPQPSPPTLPLRLTHKATCGPSSAVAEIIAPILEKLAALCKLSLTQASIDVADFLFRHTFPKKPAFAALDVVDAFWQMNKTTCLRRVRNLVRKFPQALTSFGITENALIEAIDLVWNDNLFAAMGPNDRTLFGKILGCTMGSMISMALCRIYYFTSLSEAIDIVGKDRLVWLKSGGDDALVVAWNEETIDYLLRTLNDLDDNWKYELRKPNDRNELSFFDLKLKLVRDPTNDTWTFLTGVFFKPTDSLNRTCASSFWSWDHAEALLRTHLHRTATLCSSIDEATDAILKLGNILAKRNHPLEYIVSAVERLNPVFRAEHPCSRQPLAEGTHCFPDIFGDWNETSDTKVLRLPGTIPFLGPGHNETAKRITGEFLQKVAASLKTDSPTEVSVNNIPFKTLGRMFPLAKPRLPALLDFNVVYKIQNNDNDVCGIGQVGQRPLTHRMNEHTWAAPARNPYAGTELVPFRDVTVVAKENNLHLRLAFEAIHMFLNDYCVTTPSVDITLWHNTLTKFRFNKTFPAGGGHGDTNFPHKKWTPSSANQTSCAAGPPDTLMPPHTEWTGKLLTEQTTANSPPPPPSAKGGIVPASPTDISVTQEGFTPPNDELRSLPSQPHTAIHTPTVPNPKDLMLVMGSCDNRAWVSQHGNSTLSCLLPTDKCGKCKAKCNLTTDRDLALCATCRCPFHRRCVPRIPPEYGFFLCARCEEFCKQFSSGASLIRFLNPALRGCGHHHQTHRTFHDNNTNLTIDVSRCGQTVIDILLNDSAQSPTTRNGCSVNRDGNATFPRSLFLNANKTLFDIINQVDTREGIEDAPGLMQQMCVQATLGTNAGWCTCDLLNPDAPNKLCLLHFIYFGKAPTCTRIDIDDYRGHIAKQTNRDQLTGNRFTTINISSQGVKCFFTSIATFIFGIAAYGGILKQKAILWILERHIHDAVLSSWRIDEATLLTIERRDRCLSRLATGPVESDDFPILCCWAMADLWVDLVVLSDIPDCNGNSTVFHASETVQNMQCHHVLDDLYSNSRLPRPSSTAIPFLPHVPIVHKSTHFAPLHWQAVCDSPFTSTTHNTALFDQGGYRRRTFAPIFLANILADNDLREKTNSHLVTNPPVRAHQDGKPPQHAPTFGIRPHATAADVAAETSTRCPLSMWPKHENASNTVRLLHDEVSGVQARKICDKVCSDPQRVNPADPFGQSDARRIPTNLPQTAAQHPKDDRWRDIPEPQGANPSDRCDHSEVRRAPSLPAQHKVSSTPKGGLPMVNPTPASTQRDLATCRRIQMFGKTDMRGPDTQPRGSDRRLPTPRRNQNAVNAGAPSTTSGMDRVPSLSIPTPAGNLYRPPFPHKGTVREREAAFGTLTQHNVTQVRFVTDPTTLGGSRLRRADMPSSSRCEGKRCESPCRRSGWSMGCEEEVGVYPSAPHNYPDPFLYSLPRLPRSPKTQSYMTDGTDPAKTWRENESRGFNTHFHHPTSKEALACHSTKREQGYSDPTTWPEEITPACLWQHGFFGHSTAAIPEPGEPTLPKCPNLPMMTFRLPVNARQPQPCEVLDHGANLPPSVIHYPEAVTHRSDRFEHAWWALHANSATCSRAHMDVDTRSSHLHAFLLSHPLPPNLTRSAPQQLRPRRRNQRRQHAPQSRRGGKMNTNTSAKGARWRRRVSPCDPPSLPVARSPTASQSNLSNAQTTNRTTFDDIRSSSSPEQMSPNRAGNTITSARKAQSTPPPPSSSKDETTDERLCPTFNTCTESSDTRNRSGPSTPCEKDVRTVSDHLPLESPEHRGNAVPPTMSPVLYTVRDAPSTAPNLPRALRTPVTSPLFVRRLFPSIPRFSGGPNRGTPKASQPHLDIPDLGIPRFIRPTAQRESESPILCPTVPPFISQNNPSVAPISSTSSSDNAHTHDRAPAETEACLRGAAMTDSPSGESFPPRDLPSSGDFASSSSTSCGGALPHLSGRRAPKETLEGMGTPCSTPKTGPIATLASPVPLAVSVNEGPEDIALEYPSTRDITTHPNDIVFDCPASENNAIDPPRSPSRSPTREGSGSSTWSFPASNHVPQTDPTPTSGAATAHPTTTPSVSSSVRSILADYSTQDATGNSDMSVSFTSHADNMHEGCVAESKRKAARLTRRASFPVLGHGSQEIKNTRDTATPLTLSEQTLGFEQAMRLAKKPTDIPITNGGVDWGKFNKGTKIADILHEFPAVLRKLERFKAPPGVTSVTITNLVYPTGPPGAIARAKPYEANA